MSLFLFRSQILVWQEGNEYCSLENIHAMLCMYYFICKEKWHMGQSPNFKSKPVVQVYCGLFILVTIA